MCVQRQRQQAADVAVLQVTRGTKHEMAPRHVVFLQGHLYDFWRCRANLQQLPAWNNLSARACVSHLRRHVIFWK